MSVWVGGLKPIFKNYCSISDARLTWHAACSHQPTYKTNDRHARTATLASRLPRNLCGYPGSDSKFLNARWPAHFSHDLRDWGISRRTTVDVAFEFRAPVLIYLTCSGVPTVGRSRDLTTCTRKNAYNDLYYGMLHFI